MKEQEYYKMFAITMEEEDKKEEKKEEIKQEMATEIDILSESDDDFVEEGRETVTSKRGSSSMASKMKV